MSESETPKGLRGWLSGLSGPVRVLLLVGVVCVLAAAVVLLVTRSPQAPQDLGKGSTPAASTPSSSSSATVAGSETTAGAEQSAAGESTSSAPKDAAGGGSVNGKDDDAEATAEDAASGSSEKPGSTPDQGETPEVPAKDDDSSSGSPVTLTAKLRKAIALEVIAMDKKAVAVAQAKYPTDPNKGGSKDNYEEYIEYRDLLDAQYKAVIVKKYGLSTDQLIGILVVEVPKYE